MLLMTGSTTVYIYILILRLKKERATCQKSGIVEDRSGGAPRR